MVLISLYVKDIIIFGLVTLLIYKVLKQFTKHPPHHLSLVTLLIYKVLKQLI